MRVSILLIIGIILSNHAFCQADTGSIKKKDSLTYATVHFYRAYIPKFVAPIKRAPIYINDSLVHELRGNTIASFNINKEGKLRVAVDKKGQTEIEFKVKFGKEYFFKVEVSGGVLNTRITIESVTPAFGKEDSGMLQKEGN